jgi:hypothetical protein
MKTAIPKVAEFSAPKWKLYDWITKSLQGNKSVLTEFYLTCLIRESNWDSCTFDSCSKLSLPVNKHVQILGMFYYT